APRHDSPSESANEPSPTPAEAPAVERLTERVLGERLLEPCRFHRRDDRLEAGRTRTASANHDSSAFAGSLSEHHSYTRDSARQHEASSHCRLQRRKPPSESIVCPVIHSASSLQSQAMSRAASSACPQRPNGIT